MDELYVQHGFHVIPVKYIIPGKKKKDKKMSVCRVFSQLKCRYIKYHRQSSLLLLLLNFRLTKSSLLLLLLNFLLTKSSKNKNEELKIKRPFNFVNRHIFCL